MPDDAGRAGIITRSRRGSEERRPGLREPLSSRVGVGNEVTSVTSLPYVRSIEPGHPDHHQVIRGECWIASRSDLPRAGQARMAWPGHPKLTRSRETEVYPSGPGIWVPGSGKYLIPHQTKRRVFLYF